MKSPFKLAPICICLLAASQAALAGPPDCAKRTNNTFGKLLECVTIEGVTQHLKVFQSIADAPGNDGTRAAETTGYIESANYVAGKMNAAGYHVTVQPFEYPLWYYISSTLQQTAPSTVSYVYGTDYNVMSHSDGGNVTAAVSNVDLPAPGITGTSGCEAADFAGFTNGHIALVQRGGCSFVAKASNAAAAGAAGVIIFNRPGSGGLPAGTVGTEYGGGIPVFETTYDIGHGWADTPGLELHMVADVFRETVTSYNVLAESREGDPTNVVMVGAHLDSVREGAGINDNGTGSAAILETALQMAKVKPVNKLRFAWWGAEEDGFGGSLHYIGNLTQDQRDAIALYLNFDTIGSPNYGRFILNGHENPSYTPAPGSSHIEATFARFYSKRGLYAEISNDYTQNSDSAIFLNVTNEDPVSPQPIIPIGGIASGLAGIKTADQAAPDKFGGTANAPFDACYHKACDDIDNVDFGILDLNADAVAYATLQYAMNTEGVNGKKGKGNFK